MTEQTVPLPPGWVAATVGDTATYINGLAFKPSDWVDEGYPIIRIQNLTDESKPLNRTLRTVDASYLVKSGDILVSWSATLDAFTWKRETAILNQHIFKVVPNETVVGRPFLYYLLCHTISALRASAHLHGSTMSHINRGPFLGFTVSLAPLNEQIRIVSAIDTHFTRLDVAVAALRRTRTNLKRYRAAVLKAACEGRLVPTEAALACTEGRDYESGEHLLARILAERRARWEAVQQERFAKSGKQPPFNWRAKYEEPAAPDTGELAEGWCWASLAHLKEFSLYGPRFSSDDYSAAGKLVLRTSDISQSGRVRTASAPRLTLSDAEFAKYRVDIGDLLITRTGSLGTLAVFDDDVEAIPGAYLIQYRLIAPVVTSWYIFYFLKSPVGQGHLVGGGAGVGRPNLNAPTIEAVPVPLPPLAEQQRIVAEVERRLSVVDQMEAAVGSGLKRAERLRQAILKRAFEGRLVPQDPNDEPASVLLERIRAERGMVDGDVKKRGRNRTADARQQILPV